MTAMDHSYAEEHGLVDAYLQERLSEAERNEFEAHFFACETCLAQLETANDFREGMRDVAAEETARAQLGTLTGLAMMSWRRRLLIAGSLLIVAISLGFFLIHNRNLERQLAEARTTQRPIPPPAVSNSQNSRLEAEMRNLRESTDEDLKRMEDELAKERQASAGSSEETSVRPQVNVPIFVLAAVRSGEEPGREPVNRLPLPATDGSVVLALELATIDYPAYRASLHDGKGKELWQARDLHPDSRDTLTILLPSSMLDPGVYELTIEGEGKNFVVGAYPFRVLRP